MTDAQKLYASGKLLLTSEYFILDGAQALALPTKFGQTLEIKQLNAQSESPKLEWYAYDANDKMWLSAVFDLNDFTIISSSDDHIDNLQKILQQARYLNPDFLRSGNDFCVDTHLEFNRSWGLGSSSTLIYMIAQWANICPFELLDKTLGGSGYDIACAGVQKPILYSYNNGKADWQEINFDSDFKENLYFVYLNKKQSTEEAVKYYKSLENNRSDIIEKINEITQAILHTKTLKDFDKYIDRHEEIIADELAFPRIQEKFFSDYWGKVKSLGAWGGDFILVTSSKSFEETKKYFSQRGFDTILKYREIIL